MNTGSRPKRNLWAVNACNFLCRVRVFLLWCEETNDRQVRISVQYMSNKVLYWKTEAFPLRSLNFGVWSKCFEIQYGELINIIYRP